jgi:hypothetical protein
MKKAALLFAQPDRQGLHIRQISNQFVGAANRRALARFSQQRSEPLPSIAQ